MVKAGKRFIGRILLGIICLAANSAWADDFAMISAEYGKPIEKIELESLRKVIWRYPRREFVFVNGRLLLPQEVVVTKAPPELPQTSDENVKKNVFLVPARVPTADLIKEIFSEIKSKNPASTAKLPGTDLKDNKRPSRLPTLPLQAIQDEEEEEEIG